MSSKTIIFSEPQISVWRTLTGASQLTWKWAIRLSSKQQVR